mmetsp:Transcript_23308/g.20195  ORF Transcript_23308/g.20195 Transcript_23308/m.20195 type:complete len:265 (+) Transcript_23308:3632-4426(+)
MESIRGHINFQTAKFDGPTTIYVKVFSYNAVLDENDAGFGLDTVYKIRGDHYDDDVALPFNYIKAGDDGRIDWDAVDDETLRIKFQDIQILNTGAMKDYTKDLDLEYHYDVYVTNNDRAASSLARCDYNPNKEGIFTGAKTYSTNLDNVAHDWKERQGWKYIDTHIDNPSASMYVSLRITTVGRDSEGRAMWHFPVVYSTSEVMGAYHPEGNKFLILTAFILLVAAVSGMLYYRRKYNIAKTVLKYEMRDVSDLAGSDALKVIE